MRPNPIDRHDVYRNTNSISPSGSIAARAGSVEDIGQLDTPNEVAMFNGVSAPEDQLKFYDVWGTFRS